MRGFQTAFEESEKRLRRDCHSLKIDKASFENRVLPCQLKQCRGACCHDGVRLSRSEVEVLFDLLEANKSFFESIIPGFPNDPFEHDSDGWKTATSLRESMGESEEYPAHFPATACVFLTEDSLCGLQLLALKENRHRWFYKPIPCWLHPMKILEGETLCLTFVDEKSDPQRTESYPGFACQTACGKIRENGIPAINNFEAEIQFLEEILGRKLLEKSR